ncbi:major facilitator superfamily domain-containing protein [Xylaria acuta]|nr:major facilitator superfamily domain-containing protein [Xylaria acuta]
MPMHIMAVAQHYGERRVPSPKLDEEENEEELGFDESSNGLLMEDMDQQSYPSTKSSCEILVLTISLAGLQSAYCSQFADGTDFLLDIGISPTVIASVWIIPPLCGATLQPVFGILSDRLKEKVGRREPFVLVGGIGLLCALLTQAWSSTIADNLDGSCEGTWPACRTKVFVNVFAVVVLYASAQSVQAGTRAKMIDECHVTQQLDVNAWASRVISLTSVLYYVLSYGLTPLRTIELRMQELALISGIIIVGAISIACVTGFQTPPPYPASRALTTKNPLRNKSYVQQLKETVTTRMTKILAVQFLSSFAWFPYLFYISRYITEKGHGEGNTAERLGPLALFLQSVVHLTTSLVLPSLVSHTTDNTNSTTVAFNIPKLEPIRIWRLSLTLYSAFVAGILLTNSTAFMLALTAMTGFCWAVTQIIPYTMLTDEFILRKGGDHRRSSRSGLFLGINNLSLTIPQIIAGLICTTIFSTVSERHTNSLSDGMTRSLAAGSLVSLLATVASFCI